MRLKVSKIWDLKQRSETKIKQSFENARQMTALVDIILKIVSKDSRKDELSEISLHGTVYDFSDDDRSIEI